MRESELLLTLAEIAIAFAGFASVVVVFRRRDRGAWRVHDSSRFRAMLINSLIAAVAAVYPPVAVELGIPGGWTYGAGSLVLGLLIGASPIVNARLTLRTIREGSGSWPVAITLWVGSFVAAVALLLNALAIGFERSAGPFTLGVVWLLVVAGIFFFRLVAARDVFDESAA